MHQVERCRLKSLCPAAANGQFTYDYTVHSNGGSANLPTAVTIQGCNASNTCSSGLASTPSPQFTLPDAPNPAPTASATDGTDATVSWGPAGNTAGTAYLYNLQIVGSSTFLLCTTATRCPSVTANTVPLPGLTPNTHYQAFVAAADGNFGATQSFAEHSASIASHQFWTPPLAPNLGSATTVGKNYISVTFTPPANSPVGQTYYISYAKASGGSAVVTPDSPGSPIVVSGLSAGTQYTFNACTHSANFGDSSSSPACAPTTGVQAWTKFDAPSVTVVPSAATFNSFHLTVNSPETPGCAQVTFSGPSAPSPFMISSLSTNMSVDVNGVLPNSQYTGISVAIGGRTPPARTPLPLKVPPRIQPILCRRLRLHRLLSPFRHIQQHFGAIQL